MKGHPSQKERGQEREAAPEFGDRNALSNAKSRDLIHVHPCLKANEALHGLAHYLPPQNKAKPLDWLKSSGSTFSSAIIGMAAAEAMMIAKNEMQNLFVILRSVIRLF